MAPMSDALCYECGKRIRTPHRARRYGVAVLCCSPKCAKVVIQAETARVAKQVQESWGMTVAGATATHPKENEHEEEEEERQR